MVPWAGGDVDQGGPDRHRLFGISLPVVAVGPSNAGGVQVMEESRDVAKHVLAGINRSEYCSDHNYPLPGGIFYRLKEDARKWAIKLQITKETA